MSGRNKAGSGKNQKINFCSRTIAFACILLVLWITFLGYMFKEKIVARLGLGGEIISSYERFVAADKSEQLRRKPIPVEVSGGRQNRDEPKTPAVDKRLGEPNTFASVITKTSSEEKPLPLSGVNREGVLSRAEESHFHVIFSTDCSFYQDWQTILVFHSAIAVGQKGDLTRIASGCNEEQQKTLTALYVELFPDHRFRVHFTPDFKKDPKSGESYDFYNKPYGVHHWLANSNPPVKDGTVIALIDPDFIFLRPLTAEVAGQSSNIYMNNGRRFSTTPDSPLLRVERGKPVGQLYGLGAPWASPRPNKNFNKTHICGEGSPCLHVTVPFGELHYSVGPPYILEKTDLQRLTTSWVDIVPRVYEKYPELLAEMFAYSMAAAHQELPHLTMVSHMVSNVHMGDEEGWRWIDQLGDNVCVPPSGIDAGVPPSGIFYPGKPLPTFAHHCQFFRAGELGFQKRRVRKVIFNCDHPLMAEPPIDLGKVNYKNRDGEIVRLTAIEARRNAFMLCVIHRSINAMLVYYKGIKCPKDGTTNYNKTINAVKWEYLGKS